MGKRSSFDRIPRDCYDTPAVAVPPLLVHLPERFRFLEPCAGRGALVDSLIAAGGECVGAFDIEPRRKDIGRRDAMTMTPADVPRDTIIITNPPHSRGVLHSLIALFASLAPTWLLLDSDWKENMGSAELIGHLRTYQPFGRVVWMPGTTMNGKENYGWYGFDRALGAGYRAHARIPRRNIGVSDKAVGKARKSGAEKSAPARHTGKDGKSYAATKKRKPSPRQKRPPDDEPDPVPTSEPAAP